MKIVLPLVFFLLFIIPGLQAQEQMMAERNKLLSLNYGLMNTLVSFNMPDNITSIDYNRSYTTKYSRPISLTLEYALRNQTNIGLNFSYFSYQLSENVLTLNDTSFYQTKGKHISIHLRSLRYLVHRSKFMMYFFGHAGIKTASKAISSTRNNTLEDSKLNDYYPFLKDGFLNYSLEFGMGTKILFTRSIGLNLEFGVINAVAQAGIFYRILERSRKTKDVYGW